jgi:hypothetical protein
VWYSGALDGGEFYPVAPSEVAHELAIMGMPSEIEDSLDGNDMVRLKTTRRGNDEVRWDVMLNGIPIARFTADLEAAKGGTNVTVDFELSDSSLGQAAGKDTPLSTELVQTIAEIALAEQVDSTLEKREFDRERVANAAAGWIAAHPGATMAYGLKMQAMVKSASPELQQEVMDSIEANPPMPESGPSDLGEGASTDPYDQQAAEDQYEASRPMDES